MVIIKLTEKQFLKLKEILENIADMPSSFGNYSSPELLELRDAIKNQSELEEQIS